MGDITPENLERKDNNLSADYKAPVMVVSVKRVRIIDI
jgi:hypothetical protein